MSVWHLNTPRLSSFHVKQIKNIFWCNIPIKNSFLLLRNGFKGYEALLSWKNNNKQDELFHIITMFIDAISQLYVHENT